MQQTVRNNDADAAGAFVHLTVDCARRASAAAPEWRVKILDRRLRFDAAPTLHRLTSVVSVRPVT
jgi:hypothetical protein